MKQTTHKKPCICETCAQARVKAYERGHKEAGIILVNSKLEEIKVAVLEIRELLKPKDKIHGQEISQEAHEKIAVFHARGRTEIHKWELPYLPMYSVPEVGDTFLGLKIIE